MSELFVRTVRGRYGRGVLRGANIEAQVQEIGRLFRVRLDDAANPEAWIELIVEVTDDVPANGAALSA